MTRLGVDGISRARRDDVSALNICYWSLLDPLCQTQSLAYLRKLAERGLRFALMTFEQPGYAVKPRRATELRNQLAVEGIYWYPLNYHKRPLLLAKGLDFSLAIVAGLYIALKHKPRVIHSRGSIASVIGVALSRLCGITFLYDADSMISEEYADTGHWSRASLRFRATARLERIALSSAHSVVVLTERMRSDFMTRLEPQIPVKVIPCCVDTDNFGYDPGARSLLRNELGLDTDERLLVYVGKIGPRYLVEETFRFFRVVRERLSTARLLILTGDQAAEFRQPAARAGVDEAHYHVRRADRSEVSKWLSASDAGLAFIRKTDCERASSPIKVGEYLAVGLPVVITGGIGDYSDFIAVKRLGAVVNELSDADYVKCVDHLNALWAEGNQLRERCRAVAESYVSLKSVGAPRYQAVYEELLTSKTSAAAREREVGV